MHPIFLPLILVEAPRAPKPAAAAPPVREPAPPTDRNLDLDLSLNLTAEPAWAEPGEVVTFTVTAANTWAEPRLDVTLTAPLASGFVYVAQSAQGFVYEPSRKELTWAAGDLAAGTVITGSFQARVQGVAIGETLTQTVTATSPGMAAPVTTEAAIRVVPPRNDEARVTPETGGWLRSTDGRVLVRVPPGAVRQPTQLRYQARPAPNGLLAAFVLAGPAEGFGQPAQLWVRSPAATTARDRDTVRLLAWHEEAGDWLVLPATTEPDTDSLTVTIYGAGVYATAGSGPTYGVTLLPSLKAFTSELWSGAAVVDYDLDVPAGPAGLGLNLRLAYNSQGSNILEQVVGSQYRAQASWVGLGWELAGIGSISRPLGQAGPYTLSFGGGAFEIKDVGGVLTTDPQGFLKIEHSGGLTWNTQPWTVRTPDGLTYTFGNPNGAVGGGTAYTAFWTGVGVDCSVRATQWGLTRIADPAGNRWDITWAHELKGVSNGCSGDAGQYTRASYPDTLSLTPAGAPAATVRVRLVREARADKNICKYNDSYQINTFGDGRLHQVFVEAKTANGWQLLRRYDLGYTYDGTTLGCGADPGSGNHSLLTAITQVGANGTSALPATTFGYQGSGNSVRLRTANNGYGGQVQFTYSPQWVANNAGCTSYQWQMVTQKTVTNGSTAHGLGLLATTIYTPTGAYAYVTPVGCNNGAEISRTTYEFLGHTAVQEVVKDAVGQAVTQRSHSYSYQYDAAAGKPDPRKGKETLVVTTQPGGSELARTATEWLVGTVSGVAWPYINAITQTTGGSATVITRYAYDPANQGGAQYGNVTHVREYVGGATTPYRTTLNGYVPNTTAWIVNRPAYTNVYVGELPADLSQVAASTWYIYSDNQTNPSPDWNQPVGSKGQLRGVRRYLGPANGGQFVDTRYWHDAYGNVSQEQAYRAYGTTTAWASTVANTTTTAYDTVFRTYPLTQTITPAAVGGVTAATLTTSNQYYGINAEAGQGSGLVGQLQRSTDPNGAVTRLTYDTFGRVTEIRKPGAGWTNPATEKYAYTVSPAPLAVKHSLRDDPNGDANGSATYLDDWTYYDGLGQVIQTQREAASGSQSIVTSMQYHPLGGVKQQNVPYFYAAAGGTYRAPDWNQPKTQTTYDALGRPTLVTAPDGTTSETRYAVEQNAADPDFAEPRLAVYTIDANRHFVRRASDVFGNLRVVSESTGSWPAGAANPTWGSEYRTRYTYDVAGRLLTVRDHAGNQTTLTYDLLGRKTSMSDPDMGAWSYAYDSVGNLTRQTDARGQTICFFYDELNRLKGKTYRSDTNCPTTDPGSYAVGFTYDSTAGGNKGVGRRTGMATTGTDANSATWVYDARGRVTKETRTIGAVSYVTDTSYDSADRAATLTYPADAGGVREVVAYTYDAASQLTQLRSTTQSLNYVSGLTYNALGQVNQLTYGNNIRERRGYYGLGGNWDSRPGAGLLAYGKLWRIQAQTATGAPLLDLRYNYDNVGNITRSQEAPRSASNWPTTYTFQDPFNSKNTTTWTWSSQQTVPYNDGGNNVVKSTGTGSNWNATFYRSTAALSAGQGLSVRFKVDSATANALWAIETANSARRFAIYATGGKLIVQYNDGGGWRYPTDLITALQANTWYVARIVMDDVRGFYLEVYQENTPTVRGSYQQWMPTGLSWRFRHWIYNGNAYLDDYREFSASGLTWNVDERMNFGYDALNRLTSTAPDSGAGGYSHTYGYAANGNITARTDVGSYTYPTAAQARPHAATAAGANTYSYDANGNMLTRAESGVTYTQTWDAENRLKTVTVNGQTTTYTYDGDGQRARKVQGGQTTVYIGDYYEKNLGTGVVTKYYYANGQRVAERQGSTVYYITGDHLGSTSLITNASGGEVARQKYFPYGAPRAASGTLPTDYRFTG